MRREEALGEPLAVKALLVLLVPLRLVCLRSGELALRSLDVGVSSSSRSPALVFRRATTNAMTTSGTTTTAKMIHGITLAA